ncbi:MAG TPA: pitrilysin family protein [Planktothrix sp.]|jgi:zinc protease
MINTVGTADKKLAELGIRKVSEVKNVVEYVLDNGLKVLLLENHSAPVITLLVLYKVGSRNEAVGHTGSTHFLEHMLFKGTKKHNPEKGNGIDDLLTQIGAYWNATTWFDRTSYFEVVPAEYLELCIKLEADRMRNLLLRQEDHDSEMSVVRNELERGENFPEDALEKEMYALAFREHPYHHPTIGWRSDVEGVPMDRLREFYNTFYWPNNATVILVGDFENTEALSMIHKYYGKIPSSPNPIPDVYTVEPPQEGERRFQIKRVGDLPRVWLGYHIPEAKHEDTYPLAAMRHILGSSYERSSRLYKRLIDTSMASEIFARHDDLRDPALFMVGATTNQGVDLKEVEEAIQDELEKFAREPVTEQELSRAKTANRKGTILSKADPSSLAFMLGEAESKQDWHWLMEYDDNFDAVTADDIMRVAAIYFDRDNRTVGTFIPKEPSAAEVSAFDDEGDGEELPEEAEEFAEERAESADLSSLIALRPPMTRVKLEKPKKRTVSFESQVVKEVLPNGMTLLLMRNPGTESVGLTGYLRGGKYFSHDLGSNVSEIMADVMPKGSKNYSKLQIAEALENMGIPGGLDLQIDNYRMSFSSNIVVADLPEYLRLLNDVLRNPTFAEDELAKTKIEWHSRYTEALTNTRTMAWVKLRRSLYPEKHLFYEKTYEELTEELNTLDVEKLRQIHNRLFTPHSSIITLVGDFEIDEARKLIRDQFGDWQGKEPRKIEVAEVKLPQSRQRHDVFLADKKSADIVIAHPSDLRRAGKDYYAAKLANAALGQDTITSRLGNVVRDRAGLTYGIHSSFSDTAFGSAPWAVTLSVNPANIEKSLQLVSLVLDDYIQNGITEDELLKETGRAVGSFTVGLASSLGIARALTEFEFLGLGVAELDNVSSEYLAITKQQVDSAIRKYLHPSRAITVVAGTL